MGTRIVWLWLITLSLVTGREKHYMGGSISFTWSTCRDLKLTIVTGWAVGTGPCEKDANSSLKEMVSICGRWETTGLSTLVSFSQQEGYIIDVNQQLGWEQEVVDQAFALLSTSQIISVGLQDLYWRRFDYNVFDKANLYVGFSKDKRNDTGQPNSSPVVMFNPLYRVQLNKETKIYLATADPDDDIVQCSLNLKEQNMQMVTVSKDCSLTVEANERDGFWDQGIGIVNLVVRDFNRHALTLAGEELLGGRQQQPLSSIPVQFMVQTVELADSPGPFFVPPTKENHHVFFVYLGAALEIPLYAKLSAVGKKITFHAKSVPHTKFILESPQTELMHGEYITHSTLSWRSRSWRAFHHGVYMFTVSVRDDKGKNINIRGVNEGHERSFKVFVKDPQIVSQTTESKTLDQGSTRSISIVGPVVGCVAGLMAGGVVIFLIKKFCCPCSKINKVRTDLLESMDKKGEQPIEGKQLRPSLQETEDCSGV